MAAEAGVGGGAVAEGSPFGDSGGDVWVCSREGTTPPVGLWRHCRCGCWGGRNQGEGEDVVVMLLVVIVMVRKRVPWHSKRRAEDVGSHPP